MGKLAESLSAFALALFLVATPAVADTGKTSDAVVEQRVMALAEELRCLVCQNQSLADSHAELAIDLRDQIREQVLAGRSNQEVIDYLVARYGDFVRYRPPVTATTSLLWFGPFVLLVVGVGALVLALRRRRATAGVAEDDAADEMDEAGDTPAGRTGQDSRP